MKNITGNRYGKLVVLWPNGSGDGGRVRWMCQCDCGNRKPYFKNNLDNGRNHCGCEANKTFNIKHGMRSHELYGVWNAMLNRCHNSSNASFPEYGGRGIKVCARWHKVSNFIDDMHPRPHGASLDRIDVNGDYEPSNIRWANNKVQRWNQRTTCKIFPNGMSTEELAKSQGLKAATIRMRLHRGWTDKEIINGKRSTTI